MVGGHDEMNGRRLFSELKSSVDAEERGGKISTGLADLDLLLSGRVLDGATIDAGGFVPGGLYTLAGTTGFGKSALALQIAASVARSGVRACYASLEMTGAEVVARLAAAEVNARRPSGMPQVFPGDVASRSRLDRIGGEALRDFVWAVLDAYEVAAANLDIMPCDIGAGDVDAITARADAVGARLLVLDYLQILGARAGLERGTDIQIIRDNVHALKCWAAARGAVVLLLSAVNRANYTGHADAGALKGSGDIEFSSDGVLMLDPDYPDYIREWFATVPTGQREQAERKLREWYLKRPRRLVSVRLVKNRHGRTGEVVRAFVAAEARFVEPGAGDRVVVPADAVDLTGAEYVQTVEARAEAKKRTAGEGWRKRA